MEASFDRGPRRRQSHDRGTCLGHGAWWIRFDGTGPSVHQYSGCRRSRKTPDSLVQLHALQPRQRWPGLNHDGAVVSAVSFTASVTMSPLARAIYSILRLRTGMPEPRITYKDLAAAL